LPEVAEGQKEPIALPIDTTVDRKP
jgi:hypothetical protein